MHINETRGAPNGRRVRGFLAEKGIEVPGVPVDLRAGALHLFDASLASRRFLAGEQFSIADITLGVTLDFAAAVKLALPFELPNIVRYRAELAVRPSWEAEDETCRFLGVAGQFVPLGQCLQD